jgi:hypothetical protein
MIRIFGDVHAKFHQFDKMLEDTPKDYAVVQVGDFGIWPNLIETDLENGFELSRPVYFIDGNHEHFPSFEGVDEVTELYPNMFYVPRGTVMDLDGRKILFLGGGESPDKNMRTEGVNWFREESITYADVMKIDLDQEIDMMVTHVPPYDVVNWIFQGDTPEAWNWSSKAVQGVWEALGRPELFCGHLHFNKCALGVTVIGELSYVDV